MGKPYQVGDIVAGAVTGVPIVVVSVLNNKWEGVALREGRRDGTHTLKGQIIKPPQVHSFGLHPFCGELTDEEQAAAMMYVLLGGPNNG